MNLPALLRGIRNYFLDPYGKAESQVDILLQAKREAEAMNELVAICVGHSRTGDNGAASVDGMSEWKFNDPLADEIVKILGELGVPAFKLNSYEGKSYGGAMRWVAANLEQKHASLAVELHFNAANGVARGHEWLFWSGSKRSSRLATCLLARYQAAFPEIPLRGIKPKTAGDRGAEFLKLTHCPAVICEPFFGDNQEDWKIATDRKSDIARAIAAGIHDYFTI
jgi:N-acetylmuramoyl-L-alanine amidase